MVVRSVLADSFVGSICTFFLSFATVVNIFSNIKISSNFYLSFATAVNISSNIKTALKFQFIPDFDTQNYAPQLQQQHYAQKQFVQDVFRTPHRGQQLVSSMLGDKLLRALDGLSVT